MNQTEKLTTGQGIWRYADFYAEKVPVAFQLNLGDGETPLLESPRLARELGLEKLFLKREDENESGSLKGRSLAYQVSLLRSRGEKTFVLSTSGNAGIAAARYAAAAGMRAIILLSPQTERAKLLAMSSFRPFIIVSNRAPRLANYIAAKYSLSNLRPTLDDASLEGFKSIAWEIDAELKSVDAVFTFVTSGSSFLGMHQAFLKDLQSGAIAKLPRMFAVQAGSVNSLSESMTGKVEPTGVSSAGRCGIRRTPRRAQIIQAVVETGGGAIYVADAEVLRARQTLEWAKIFTSDEGATVLAALSQVALKQKIRSAVLILSGKKREPADEVRFRDFAHADTFEQVDELMAELNL